MKIIIKIAMIPIVILGFIYGLLIGFFRGGISMADAFVDWMDLS